ncbi:hypothetical protein B0H66DRAFT_573480 [Apodospora peruviana]|uniref:UBA domain-containing protein n=1 Tax=Apodospora peruviana TaxID=516989 RepID=A0AAE0IIG1_9PEZI|nr:hypothetical protein B0H66DRAFT_573480 [Apodospora peruviana]
MDDLSSLNWSAPNPAKPSQPTSSNPAPAFSSYPSLRPTPSPLGSGRNTPLSAQGSGNIGPKPALAKPASDSFSNLVNFGSGKSNVNLSLRERQDRLEAERRRKEEEKRKQVQAQYGDGQFFDSLAQSRPSRTASPAVLPAVTRPQAERPAESDDDLFAAFNSKTKVDNSSHYPPPPSSNSPSPANALGLDLRNPNAWGKSIASGKEHFPEDDDDPFGLSQLKPRASVPPAPVVDEDDDLLGDLAKPVDQVRKQQTKPVFTREPEPGKAIEDSSSDSEPEPAPTTSGDPFDQAVAQLVDYGFTPENARRGLTESGGRLNVQAAVNWLLDDAHRQAKEKAKGKNGQREQPRDPEERSSSQPRNGGPAWMRDEPQRDNDRDRNNRSPASADGDFTKTAAAMGTTLFKTANSLWKTGQKKVQKAVSEFQQDGDPNQPKWMRSAQQEHSGGEGGRREVSVTDEAMMLESGGGRPKPRPARSGPESRPSSTGPAREHSPALSAGPPRQVQKSQVPKWQQTPQPSLLDPRARLNKQAAEDEGAPAYISPARRRKVTPQPEQKAKTPVELEEPDLLFNSTAPPKAQNSLPSRPSQQSSSPAPRPSARQSPAPLRPAAAAARPPRQIPSISAIALQSSTKHRLDGTAHFKRGDYAAAHASYTNSLTGIPQDHPLVILLRCNRSLTALKTGEPRQAVDDADTALRLIGPGKGEGEHVEIQGPGSSEKRDMRELYGKALTRKAEALEQMEKWAEAEKVWQMCVESGVGGTTATAGRQRCQKALTPKPAAVRPAAATTPRPAAAAAAARRRPQAVATHDSSEAVERLRAANQAAEKEGIEKIALMDKVDARVAAWRDGKRDNLRALLSSLDNVLWEGSGWKKVGLHELVITNKVKVVYMKAIAKTHPDKIAQDASTEVRMIAGTVFSTLNEAWDKFKADNGL